MTRILILEIAKPDDLEFLNSNDRRFRFNKSTLTKRWRQLGHDAVPPTAMPFEGKVHVMAHIWKKRHGRYDPNNLWPTVKAICDGLTDAGLWIDDDHEHVEGPDMRHGGYGAARVLMTVEEVR